MKKEVLDQKCPKCEGTLIAKEATSTDYVLVHCKNCEFTKQRRDVPWEN